MKAKYGDYWVVKLSYFEGNPIHKEIIFINDADKQDLLFTAISSESKFKVAVALNTLNSLKKSI